MEAVRLLNLDGKKWSVEIKRVVKKRTLSQNALMWMWHSKVLAAVAKDTGATVEDIHDHMKQKFLTPTIVEIGDEIHERYSTKNLTPAEMSEFMDRIYAWVTGDLGLLLPLPIEHGREPR